jgi:hypothetical protein
MDERQEVLALPSTEGRTMKSHKLACSLALAPLVVVLSGAVTGCSGSADQGAAATPSKSTVPVASPEPANSTCKGLVPEVLVIAAEGGSGYPKIVRISGLTVVEDRQADYNSGALTPAANTQVPVLTCRGTARWDDKSTTGVQFELSYDFNGGRSVAYQRM